MKLEHVWQKYEHLGERCTLCAKERTLETENAGCSPPRGIELIRPIKRPKDNS